jgi:hypothetical protein
LVQTVTTKLLVLIACVLLTACGAGNNCVGHNGCGDSASSTTTTTTTPTSATTYTIGGTITGLTSGSLILQNNSGDALTISANSSTFVFATGLVSGATYSVTVGTQPTGLTCSVTSGTGTVVSSNVTSVVVTCVANWIGTKQLGVAGGSTLASSIAIDVSGNVYVTGVTGAVGLDGNTQTGTNDFFVTKYNISGVKQFTKQLGVAGVATNGNSIATDVSGNVYVAGSTAGGLDGNTLTGTLDVFVTKYDSSGVKLYTKQLGVAGVATNGGYVANDASGNVYVAGYTKGGLDGNTLTGTEDVFVTKYNSSGVKLYTKQLGVSGVSTQSRSVATDVSGNVYIAGFTSGGLDGNTLTGTQDFFVTKYDSSGVKLYTKQLGVATKSTTGSSIALDASGNVFVAGSTTGGLDGNTLIGTQDFIVTKYNSSGVKQYTKQLGSVGVTIRTSSIATDVSGNFYVTGSTTGGFDGNTLTGTRDYFMTKYNSSGVKQYTKQLGVATKFTQGTGVSTDTNNNVYLTGSTSGGLDGNTYTVGSGFDFFVTKYDSTGVKQ